MSSLLRWGSLVLVGAFWGGAYACTAFLLRTLTSFELLVYRFVPVSLIAIIVILIFYRTDAVRLIKKYWLGFLGLAAVWLYGHQYTQILGQTVIPSGPAGLIIGTYPIFTVIFASIFLGEKLTRGRIIGSALAFIGTGVLVFQGASHEAVVEQIEPSQWIIYGLITFISPIGCAAHTLMARPYVSGKNRHNEAIDPIALNMFFMAPCLLLLTPMMFSVSLPDFANLEMSFWIVMSVLIIFVTIIGYFLFLWALKQFDASTVSIATYMVPVFGLVYARLWLHEPMGIPTLIGAGGILAGVVIASLDRR